MVTSSVFNMFAYGNQKLPYSTRPGVTCHWYSRRAAPHALGVIQELCFAPIRPIGSAVRDLSCHMIFPRLAEDRGAPTGTYVCEQMPYSHH